MKSKIADLPQEKGFAQQHLLPKGLKIWGDKARDAARKEMDQLHCFKTGVLSGQPQGMHSL